MRRIVLIVALALLALALPLLIPPSEPARGPGYPWQIERLADGGTRVFGLVPGHSTLTEASAAFGSSPQVAHVGVREATGNIEAFFDGVDLGGLTGRVVITADLPDQTVRAMRDRAVNADYMESATLKRQLDAADRAIALAAPIRLIAFVPGARLDDGVVTLRFGVPGERIRDAEGATHYLYPAVGLDVALGESGKAMLQYVAPRDFARLADPLRH